MAPIFTAAPAVADYSACMEFCKEEHNFAYCHKICTEDAGKMSAADGNSENKLAGNTYQVLAGNTYLIIDRSFGLTITNIIYFGHDGQTEHLIRVCTGDFHCKGQTEIEDGMVVSNLTCSPNDAEMIRKFSLEQIQDADNFTATVYSNQWDIDQGIDMNYVKVEDLDQLPEAECGN